MTTRNKLNQLLSELSEERLRQVLEYTEFLSSKDEDEAWRSFGLERAALLYEGDDSDYTVDDIKPDLNG